MVQRTRVISSDNPAFNFDAYASTFVADVHRTVIQTRKVIQQSYELIAKANELLERDREWWHGGRQVESARAGDLVPVNETRRGNRGRSPF